MGDEVAKKPRTGLSQLERLSLYTTVVADTGSIALPCYTRSKVKWKAQAR